MCGARPICFSPELITGCVRNRMKTAMVIALIAWPGCCRRRGPLLAGGREVKSWLADLRDPRPQVRRQAVLKLGNVGDTDPTAAAGLAEALRMPTPLFGAMPSARSPSYRNRARRS